MIEPSFIGRSLSTAVDTHTSVGCDWIGKLNPAGITPMMVKRVLLKSTARPTTLASPPKC